MPRYRPVSRRAARPRKALSLEQSIMALEPVGSALQKAQLYLTRLQQRVESGGVYVAKTDQEHFEYLDEALRSIVIAIHAVEDAETRVRLVVKALEEQS